MPTQHRECPDCHAPLPENAQWCPACGANLASSRPSYARVGAAIRLAHERAVAAGDLTGRDWKVLSAVIALVASWSRLRDRIAVCQISQAAGVDERNTKRALARLRDRGIITRGESAGRRAAETGLPAEPWPHTATVTTDQPGPTTATVATDERWPRTATVPESNSGQSRHPTVAADGHPPEKNSEKKAARATSETAPPGSAGGRPAPHATIHDLPTATSPPGRLEQQPRLFEDITDPTIRSLMVRAHQATAQRHHTATAHDELLEVTG